MSTTVETGTVKWFDSTKGYGFLVRDNGEKDAFVHHTGIAGVGYRNIEEGQRVEFVVVQADRGPQAQDVVVV